LEILEHEQQRPFGGKPRHNAEQELQDPRGVTIFRLWSPIATVELGHESSELGPARPQQWLELAGVELPRQRVEHVDDWREWDPAALEFDAATQEGPSVYGPRAGDELGDQPRFAHPGLAPNEERDRAAAQDRLQPAVQCLQFGFASD
jgi:hypothetical protein